jgi:hypothetical protein
VKQRASSGQVGYNSTMACVDAWEKVLGQRV